MAYWLQVDKLDDDYSQRRHATVATISQVDRKKTRRGQKGK